MRPAPKVRPKPAAAGPLHIEPADVAESRRVPFLTVALAAIIVAAYGRAITFDFVSFDDPLNVVDNPVVREGLTVRGLGWAFRTFHAMNWLPLTWLSFMVDAQLFGLAPWGYHLTNVVLHAASTALLFLVFHRLTTATWPSAFVAAVFGLHRTHVESVAWISERKDVLSTLLWMLTLWAYAGYAGAPGPRRYVVTLTAFALALLAKPMVVTLPLVLLLLDIWRRDPRRTPYRKRFGEDTYRDIRSRRASLPTRHRRGVGGCDLPRRPLH